MKKAEFHDLLRVILDESGLETKTGMSQKLIEHANRNVRMEVDEDTKRSEDQRTMREKDYDEFEDIDGDIKIGTEEDDSPESG